MNLENGSSELTISQVDLACNIGTEIGPGIKPETIERTNSFCQVDSISIQNVDLEVPEWYKIETADFPSSPGQLKLESGYIMPVETHDETADEDEERSIYQAHLLSNSTDVKLTKDIALAVKRKNQRKLLIITDDMLSHSTENLTIADTNASQRSEIYDCSSNSISPNGVLSDFEFDASVADLPCDQAEAIKELTAEEEAEDRRSWRTCSIMGVNKVIDLRVLEPYKRVVSHGGYMSKGSKNAIIIFSGCYLPDRSRIDYDYVMNQLFMYVISTLDQLVTDDYILVYLHGATQMRAMPKFSWLKQGYQMIDRKLRKNLKGLYLVHPTFWLKTLSVMVRPFISSKFGKKLFFIHSLTELFKVVPLERASIPEKVINYDFSIFHEASILRLEETCSKGN